MPPKAASSSTGVLGHMHARRAAPVEGVLRADITEDEAEALDAMRGASMAADASLKGSKAWTYASTNAARTASGATHKKGATAASAAAPMLKLQGKANEINKFVDGVIADATHSEDDPTNKKGGGGAGGRRVKEGGGPWRRPVAGRGLFHEYCFDIAEDKRFDRFILFCILVNSITLAMYDPRGVSSVDELLPMDVLDVVFLSVFFLEMCVKVCAYGWATTSKQAAKDALIDADLSEEAEALGLPDPPPRHPRYLDDNWNRLDFFIVMASLTFFLRFLNTSMEQDLDVLRTLRMLRPLRTINSIPEMRILIDSLGESAKPMANVMLLCLFLFLVFALVGQQLFAGAMTKRCYRAASATSYVGDGYDGGVDGSYGDTAVGSTVAGKFVGTKDVVSKAPVFGVELMPDSFTDPIVGRRCGGDYQCPSADSKDGGGGEWECRISGRRPHIVNEGETSWGGLDEGSHFANPNFGMTHYDDIGHALLNIFVAVTLEGWVDQMYWLQDSYGKFPAVVFFLSLIIIGSLFALNLALAVISENYSANVQRDTNRIEKTKAIEAKKFDLLALRGEKQRAYEQEEKRRRLNFERRAREAALQAQMADSPESTEANEIAAAAAQEVQAAAVARDEAMVQADLESGLPLEAGMKPPPGAVVGSGGRPLYRPKNPLRALCFDLVCTSHFDSLVMVCIFLNTVGLAIPHYTEKCLDVDGSEGTPGCITQGATMDASTQSLLETANDFFLIFFTAEAALKIVGLGWAQFVVDSFNVFDLAIVLTGYLEYIPFTKLPGGNGIISAFRIFRLARVFKAAKYWPSMQAIIKTLIDTLPSLGYLTVVLCLLMFIAACTGMQVFGDVGIPLHFRANFGDFGTAMLTVFQILTGENWNDVMYMAVGHTNYGFVIYFIVVFVIGGFVILNLYLAILLSAFDAGDAPELNMDWMYDIQKAVLNLCAPSMQSRRQGRGMSEEVDDSTMHVNIAELQMGGSKNNGRSLLDDLHSKFDKTLSTQIASKEVERHVLHRQQKTEATRKALQGTSFFCVSKHNRLRLQLARIVHTHKFDNVVLALIVVSTILLAFESPKLTECATACPLYVFLLYCDIVFTVLFIIEMALKVVVYGFISTKSAYLKDPWNVLDFFIVVVGTVSIAFSFLEIGSDIAWIRSLRALRALRPLRTIKRAPGMRMAVNTLFDCAPAFLNIGMVALVFYLAFAIIGVEFFGGKFWRCNDPDVSVVWECTGTFFEVSENSASKFVERKWENPPMNFDNTGLALLTLFEVAGLELWMLPMYSAMDATSMGQQPKRNTNQYSALYFVVFILFGSFLVMNLFVGAVVDNFNRQTNKEDHPSAALKPNGGGEKKRNGGGASSSGGDSQFSSFRSGGDGGGDGDDSGDGGDGAMSPRQMVTPEQKAFLDSVTLIFSRKPITRPIGPDPESSFYKQRRWAYNLVMWGPSKTVNGVQRKTLDGSYFEVLIMTVVVLNTVAMLCYSWAYPANDQFYALGGGSSGLPVSLAHLQATSKNASLDFINNVFTVVFNLELGLKLAAWGYRQYWSDRWNKLDAFVVCISDVVLVLENASRNFKFPFNPNLVRIMRLVKLMRILRVLSRGKEVIFLIETLVYSFPAIANVAALWFLVIFIYTVIGVSLYGDMAIDGEGYKFGMYNKHANFASFQTGIVTLFRMSTGESWNGLMHDVSSVHPSAWIFFFSYILLVAYLLFNLLVAIVLQQFHMESDGGGEDHNNEGNQDGDGDVDGSGGGGDGRDGKGGHKKITLIGGDQMARFQDEWVRFDPFASEYIMAIELPLILKRLPLVLCPLTEDSSTVEVLHTLANLSVNVDVNGRIHFAETYIALIQFAYNLQIHKEQQSLNRKRRKLAAQELRKLPSSSPGDNAKARLSSVRTSRLALSRLPRHSQGEQVMGQTEPHSPSSPLQRSQGLFRSPVSQTPTLSASPSSRLSRNSDEVLGLSARLSRQSDEVFGAGGGCGGGGFGGQATGEEALSVVVLEGIMGQIVAHYPALASHQLTDKPIVEFFAAQRLQAMWHRAQASKNWANMMAQLREQRDSELAAKAAAKEASLSSKPKRRDSLSSLSASSARLASRRLSDLPRTLSRRASGVQSSLRRSLSKPANGNNRSNDEGNDEGNDGTAAAGADLPVNGRKIESSSSELELELKSIGTTDKSSGRVKKRLTAARQGQKQPLPKKSLRFEGSGNSFPGKADTELSLDGTDDGTGEELKTEASDQSGGSASNYGMAELSSNLGSLPSSFLSWGSGGVDPLKGLSRDATL